MSGRAGLERDCFGAGYEDPQHPPGRGRLQHQPLLQIKTGRAHTTNVETCRIYNSTIIGISSYIYSLRERESHVDIHIYTYRDRSIDRYIERWVGR